MTQSPKREGKIYRDSHHFNPYTLVHHYEDGRLMEREWRVESRYETIGVNPLTGQKVLSAINPPRPLPHPRVRLDGSEDLETILDDIGRCFCFTGAARDEHGDQLYRAIFNTKLPSDTLLCNGWTGERLKIGWCSQKPILEQPKTYYELFGMIGLESEHGDIKYAKYADNRIVYKYPDGCCLDLEADGNRLSCKYVR